MKKKNEEWKCPFCGSKKRFLETPFIDRVTGEKETTYCCAKQKHNAGYARKHYGQDTVDVPLYDEVSKL